MKKLILVALIIVIGISCNKSGGGNKTGDPTEDLAWLKEKKMEFTKNCVCVPSIWQAEYNGKIVFEIGCAGPACNCIHLFYYENGAPVTDSEGENRITFLSKLTGQKKIWFCQ